MPQIEKAFCWRLSNIPHVARVGSSVFLTGLTVAAIGSLCVSGAVLVILNMLLVLSKPWSYRVCITSGSCGPVITWILEAVLEVLRSCCEPAVAT